MRPLGTRYTNLHDPAPSRLSYRLMRFMLTPLLRRLVFYGIPGFVLALAVGLYFADEEHRENLRAVADDVHRSIIERPEFKVSAAQISGAGPTLEEDIREVLPVDFPISSFSLNVQEMRKILVELDPVADASLQVRDGILFIDVSERKPAFVWRKRDGLELLDETGHYVRSITARMDYPSLPLVAGEGADKNIAEARALLASAMPLADRMRGLIYVGERRWDLALDRNQRIMLPAEGAVQALEKVLILNDTQELLDRAISVVDMRLSERPTLRLNDGTSSVLLRQIKSSGADQ
jgi:cell division protein FtsQ